ncbi:uncharacterized protein [Antennarius striatus]|uniref:uncharacterized protein isoform X2 n=1 Tax=Antennarius striatus TaxID=241820 RepID=UPI0035AFC09B
MITFPSNFADFQAGQEGFSRPLPADHVLQSGAVLFPGAFDQHGCPLVVFPPHQQHKLSSQVSKAEVVDFINYFLCLHNKKQEKKSLVSVVVDLRHAGPPVVRLVAETLLLLESDTVHSVYILQPRKKDAVKLLLKVLAPSKSSSLKKVLLKEVSELSNYIDRSQLTTQLGGYFMYCHQSWVSFIKEMDSFDRDFLSVVQKLPPCISSLQALCRQPLPPSLSQLHAFCSTNEAKFQQLRREVGLDDLLRRCELVVEKLRHPEKDPCFQAMAGTALFTHTAFEMLQNHSRIAAAVEKVELLWLQGFSAARLQLKVLQLREDALQITERITTLYEDKLQLYRMEVEKDAVRAALLLSDFEASTHTPAMVPVVSDVIHTWVETPPPEGRPREPWILELGRLKEKLCSAVTFIHQHLTAVSRYHWSYNKASSWYHLVLCESFLQDLLSGVDGEHVHTRQQRSSSVTVPVWRERIYAFLRRNPPPELKDLVQLAHLSDVIPDDEFQLAGKQMSHRCVTLRKLLMSSGPVAVGHLQLALQWQFEWLRSSRVDRSSAVSATDDSKRELISGTVSAEGKPQSLSSFDSGFHGAGSSHLEAWGGTAGREGLSRSGENNNSGRPGFRSPEVDSVSEDHREQSDCGSVGNSSRTSIQVLPKGEALNFEIKVKRTAAQQSNPWLSLPVDDLNNSYTVTITQNPRDHHSCDPRTTANHSNWSSDQLTRTEVLSSTWSTAPQNKDWMLHSQSAVEDAELSPIYNVLSSTLTDGGEQSICPAGDIHTLLWDSYDLHAQKPDSVDSLIDVSLEDWELKEQRDLKEVEKTLERTNDILEKEEHVLAQEAELEALLRSEDQEDPWLWNSEDQHRAMSSNELAEAGILGLEDDLDSAELDHHSELGSPASENDPMSPEDLGQCAADTVGFQSGVDVLTELRKVQILDELITEENLSIQMLRHSKEKPQERLSGAKPSDVNRQSSLSKEREAFRLQLEKEKREVDQLEESLKDEGGRREAVEVAGAEGPCEEPLSGSRSLTTHPVSSVWNTSQDQCEHVQAVLDPDAAAFGEDLTPEAEPVHSNRTTFISSPDLNGPPGDVGVQHHVLKELDGSSGDAAACKPEAVLTPETRPDDGAFDPGGTLPCGPVPKSRTFLLPVDHKETGAAELQVPDVSALQDEGLWERSQDVAHPGVVLSPHVKEHSNHPAPVQLLSETHGVETGPSGVSSCWLQTAEEAVPPVTDGTDQQSSPQLPPERLELHPSGADEQPGVSSEELCENMRTTGSRSPVAEAQINSVSVATDFRTPIVLDTGSGLMKAGFADRDLPNVVYPTIIGTPKYEEVMNSDFDREVYIGQEAQHMRGVLILKHPIKNGIIRNWNDMEKIWHHTFQQLRVDPEDHPVLLTEAAMNPTENRQRMVEIMFESFSVPFTYVALQAVLALYATGRTTGVVFDSGDGVSHSVPVFEGYCLPHAVQRFPLAGADVTMHLKKLLQEQGVNMSTTAEMEIVREMKEKCCFVALNYETELNLGGASCTEMHYTMPDGRIFTLSTERFRAPEILFKPELIGRDHYGMHESIFKSILSSDIDLRRSFLGNIVLSGGNTLLAGLPERLQTEIRGLVPTLGDSVRVTSPEDRDFSVWRGGAALASQPTFSSAWISQEEYEEYGPQIVLLKCF